MVYPITKLQWVPDAYNTNRKNDLFATSGDYLKLWEVKQNSQPELKKTFSTHNGNEYCSPLTSFDWNKINKNIIGTSSIDTTCSIWDIERLALKSQLIAHDVEVYDLSWAMNQYQFATCSADGSVRVFDLRQLDHSNVQFESPINNQVLRVAWNQNDQNYLALIQMDSSVITILDRRIMTNALTQLKGHQDSVNTIKWAPHSRKFLCSGGDDSKTLIWDTQETDDKASTLPILTYEAQHQVSSIEWIGTRPNWVGITFQNKFQLLRV